MMDRELVQQSQSEPGESTNGTSSDPTTPTTPNPPRLTPNPMLLDSPAPTLTPTTSSPPPPLTPAPSVSMTHVVKAAPAASTHILVPAPPKLTSNAAPTLRTYSRPILPSLKATPPTQTSSSSCSSSITTTSASSLFSSAPTLTKTSISLANGNTRTVSTPTSTPITPFHTPASPPGRQVSHTLPAGSPALVRAGQSSSPVRPRVSQQTLLLGKGLRGSGQDQVLLRAQMLILTSAMRPTQSSSSSSSSSSPSSNPASSQLQSLTLKPPRALTTPPSLRLKPPSASRPPLSSRPHNPLFPPLRPRPQPGTTAPESPATPCRHLAVPPPSLYSPVRAVPLRPRHLSPSGQRTLSPRQPSVLQPIALAAPPNAAPPPAATNSCQSSPSVRPRATARTSPLTPAMLNPSQSQPSSHSMVTSPFDSSSSAARQLQIIALSSGRQTPAPPGTYTHHTPEPLEGAGTYVHHTPAPQKPPGLSKWTLTGEVMAPLANPQPKNTAPSPSSPSPPTLRGDAEARQGGGGIREEGGEEVQRTLAEREEVEQMEVTEGGQTQRGRGGDQEEENVPMDQDEAQTSDPVLNTTIDSEEPSKPPSSESMIQSPTGSASGAMVQNQRSSDSMVQNPVGFVSESMEQNQRQSMSTVRSQQSPETPGQSPKAPETKVLSQRHPGLMIQRPPDNKVQTQRPPETASQSQRPETNVQAQKPQETVFQSLKPPETKVQTQRTPETVFQSHKPPESIIQRPLETHRDQHPGGPEDFSENMSDNQSALSSLSSQSPPSSPFVLPQIEAPPPLIPTDLSQHHTRRAHRTSNAEPDGEPDAKLPGQSGDESEGMDQSVSSPWEAGAWPEGRQVLTHLVEGFVIQEGLQPFPVNRSSLLVPEQVAKPPEVNGTNGGSALPVVVRRQQRERSTDSEEGGEPDEPGSRGASAHRDRTVLHCQFCGKRGHAHNFMRSKRFCSTSCARGFNVRLTKRLRALSAGSRSDRPRPSLNRAESVPGKPLLLRLPRDLWSAGRHDNEAKENLAENEEEENEEEDLEGEGMEEEDDEGEEHVAFAVTTQIDHRAARRPRRASAPAVTTTTPTSTFQPTPSEWSVEEVTAFIHTLPGCGDVAEAFRQQEIDGQALLLLTEDHLMTSMNIKLGPALKICAHINTLRNQ